MSLRVVFVNAVYPPQRGATGVLLRELATKLAGRGWDVEVVTSGRPGQAREDGVEVRRVAPAPRDGTVWRRARSSGALLVRLARAAVETDPADVVVLAADPPLLFLAGGWIRRRTGARVVHWVHDLYPDVALALGVRVPGRRALAALARRALRRCDAVVAIGRDLADRLVGRGVEPDRVTVIPNWAAGAVGPDPAPSAFRRSLGLEDPFVVLYAGTLGRAHPFDTVLDAAAELETTDPEVAWVVVGGGGCRQEVEAEARRRDLGTVRFAPPVPDAGLADMLRAGDLHLVTMNPRAEGMLVPSKTYGALAVGRPVVFVGPEGSEAAVLIQEHDLGTVVRPGDGATLAQAVRDWRSDPAGRKAAGERAARAVAGGAERAAESFDALLRRVAGAS